MNRSTGAILQWRPVVDGGVAIELQSSIAIVVYRCLLLSINQWNSQCQKSIPTHLIKAPSVGVGLPPLMNSIHPLEDTPLRLETREQKWG